MDFKFDTPESTALPQVRLTSSSNRVLSDPLAEPLVGGNLG